VSGEGYRQFSLTRPAKNTNDSEAGASAEGKNGNRNRDGQNQIFHRSSRRIRSTSPGAGTDSPLSLRKEMIDMRALALVLALCLASLAGCVSQQKYDVLEQEYQQLNQSMGAEVAAQKMQISRLQDAIKVSVNSELLFPSGGWEMSADAKQTIAKIAVILAPHQTTKINVNGYTDNTPIGPQLMKEGVTTNLILSQRRADNVMQYLISQGVKPNLVSAQGFGDANPVASNDTPAGKAQNRRVELTLANAGS
jgi:chemotaxis protein MotB